MHYFVVDIGTSHLKLGVFKPGRIHVETVERRNNLYSDRAGASEQQPAEIYHDLLDLLQLSLAKYPDARQVVFSTQMHSLLLTDSGGRVLQPSMTWADQRARMQAQLFQQSEHSQALYEISGTPIHAMSPLMKLLYLRLAQPALFLQHAPVLAMEIKTYIFWRLTGQRVVDHGTASATGLMDIRQKIWSPALLALVRLEAAQLPELVPVRSHYRIDRQLAADLGWPQDLDFHIGSTDGALANLGLAAADAADAVVFSFGTSGALRYTVNEIKLADQGQLFCYIIDDQPRYIIGGPLNNAGNVLEWIYSRFGYNDRGTFREMLLELTRHPVRARGPLFLPYLNGERAPFWNGHLRASFHHLQASDQREDLAKAAFEGIFFHARLVLDQLAATIGRQPVLYVTGKIFQDPDQLQWIANILNTKLYLCEITDGSLLGAATLLEQNLPALSQNSPVASGKAAVMAAAPIQEAASLYTEKYARFVKLAQAHQQEILAEQQKMQNNLLKL